MHEFLTWIHVTEFCIGLSLKMINKNLNLSIYIINTISHEKCFVRYLRSLCFCIRNRTSERSERVRFLIRQQLERKYRTPALSMKYSLFTSSLYRNISLTIYRSVLNKRCITLPTVYCCPFASNVVFQRFWMILSSPGCYCVKRKEQKIELPNEPFAIL